MIIDIRNQKKYYLGHLDGAINISYYDLMLYPSKYLNKNDTYYIYCDTGTNSKLLVNRLKLQGYNCVNIEGGYNNYLK